jgi:filamentous hemagglutinin
VATGTTTDTVALNSGHIANNYDAQAVQDEINLQVKVTQEFDKTRQGIKAEINEKEKAARDAAEQETDPVKKNELEQNANRLQNQGLLLDIVAGGLAAPTNAIGGIVASSLAPAVMHYLYGKDIQVNDLTAEQKSTISAIVGLGGAAIGATGGAADVTQGSMAAVNAVENNRQLVETEKQALARLKQGKTKAEQDRLDAAACFLIKCSAEFPADSQEYAYYKALENKGAGLKTEQAALLAYKNESLEYKPVGYSNFSVEKVSVKDLFRYSQADANSDSQILAYSNNSNRIRNSLKDSLNLSDETIDRALNIGQGLLLIGSVIGGKGKGVGTLDVDKLIEASKVLDKGDLTLAGRALQKHGNREGSSFPSAQGNPNKINEQAQKIVLDILNNPHTVIEKNTGRFGQVVDIIAPDGRGLRYSTDGKLIGFLEPSRK